MSETETLRHRLERKIQWLEDLECHRAIPLFRECLQRITDLEAQISVLTAQVENVKREPEVCVCAAVVATDGTIFVGRRHGDCMRKAGEAGHGRIGLEQQGFMTTRGRYVTRKEGRRLQDAAGIPSAAQGGYRGDLLFSEDLY